MYKYVEKKEIWLYWRGGKRCSIVCRFFYDEIQVKTCNDVKYVVGSFSAHAHFIVERSSPAN